MILIDFFQVLKLNWYQQVIMFHLVIDASEELSKLNRKFKFDMVDISAIGSTWIHFGCIHLHLKRYF